jgi:TRAP-type uncharacterized transport system fused permease subunit
MKQTVYGGFHFIIPIFLLIMVLVQGFTPFRAAFIAIIALLIVSTMRKASRLSVIGFCVALVQGAKNAVVIAVCCACAGIVVGCLDITGIGIKFIDIIISLAHGTVNLFWFFVYVIWVSWQVKSRAK